MGLFGRGLYDEDHDAFRHSVRRFVATDLAPRLDEWRSSGGAPAELFRAMGAQGFLGTGVPEEFRGGGVDDPLFTVVLVEELVSVGALGIAQAVACHAGVGVPALLRSSEGPERAAWLEGAAAGELLVVPAQVRDGVARAVPGGARAGLIVALPEAGDAASLVGAEGFVVEAVTVLGGRDIGAADLAVRLDGSVWPTLPEPSLVRRDLDLWSAVVAVAGARTALDLAVAYVRERKVFGRPIAEFENTRFRLAELGAELAAASCLVERSLASSAAGLLDSASASAALIVAGRVHDHAVDLGMQLHGGYGYMREYPIANAFGDARFLRLAARAAGEPREALADAVGL